MEEERIKKEGGGVEEEEKGLFEIEGEEGEEGNNNNSNHQGGAGEDEEGIIMEKGGPIVIIVCGSLIYYHCCMREGETISILSLISDVFIVLLSSLAILGMLFRQINIEVPVDPVEWQISQETANRIAACLANTLGAAESVFRVAATGHDKRLFFKVVSILYLLSATGRSASGVTVAYEGLFLTHTPKYMDKHTLTCLHMMLHAHIYQHYKLNNQPINLYDNWARLIYATGLCLFCLYIFAQSFFTTNKCTSPPSGRREDSASGTQDAIFSE